MCGEFPEPAVDHLSRGEREVHPCVARRLEHGLHDAAAVLLRGERDDVLRDLREDEGRLGLLEGDADGPRAVRVERRVEHLAVELGHEAGRGRRGERREQRLHHARALRVAEQAQELALEGRGHRLVHLLQGGERAGDVVAEGVAREREQVRLELLARAVEVRLGEAREGVLQKSAGGSEQFVVRV